MSTPTTTMMNTTTTPGVWQYLSEDIRPRRAKKGKPTWRHANAREYGPTERGDNNNNKKTQACKEIYTGTIPWENTSTRMWRQGHLINLRRGKRRKTNTQTTMTAVSGCGTNNHDHKVTLTFLMRILKHCCRNLTNWRQWCRSRCTTSRFLNFSLNFSNWRCCSNEGWWPRVSSHHHLESPLISNYQHRNHYNIVLIKGNLTRIEMRDQTTTAVRDGRKWRLNTGLMKNF